MALSRKSGKKSQRKDWRSEMLPGDDFDWQVRLKLPLLAKPFIRAKYVEPWRRDLGGQARSRGPREVGGYGKQLTPEAERALNHLIKHESTLLKKMLKGLAGFSNELRAGGGWDTFDGPPDIDTVMPRGMTPDQAAQRIQVTRVAISPHKPKDGIAYLEIFGECAWDPEHGFMAIFHRNRLVGVEQQGTGWVDRPPKQKRAKK
jgi:hypothetical protein